MQSPTMTSIGELQDECEAFLSEHYSLRPTVSRSFVWGEGSDQIVLFESPDPEAQQAEVTAVRGWRRLLFDAGLGWVVGPVDLGGRGLTRGHQQALDAACRRYTVPGNSMLTISIGMIAPTIMRHGSESLQRRIVPALQRGDLIACQLFSEPGAGSDLASLSTSARRDGDGWRITGQKVWTSGAHFSDIGEIICRTGEGERHSNLTAFLVDMGAPGVVVRPLKQMTGSAAFNEVFLDDVWVPDEDRLGDVGQGWSVALTTLANERSAIGGDGFGGSGLLNVDRYIAMVRMFGRSSDAVVRQQLVDLWIGLRVAKYTRRRASAGRASGSPPGPEASIEKLALSNNVLRISGLLSTVLGARLIADTGEWGTYAWREVVLGVPGYKIAGGTDEILKNLIGERVLGLPKEPRPVR
ncbi:MAG: acyl-CoA dehydrogenase family protein [Ilumatobacteraceae bacterium]